MEPTELAEPKFLLYVKEFTCLPVLVEGFVESLRVEPEEAPL